MLGTPIHGCSFSPKEARYTPSLCWLLYINSNVVIAHIDHRKTSTHLVFFFFNISIQYTNEKWYVNNMSWSESLTSILEWYVIIDKANVPKNKGIVIRNIWQNKCTKKQSHIHRNFTTKFPSSKSRATNFLLWCMSTRIYPNIISQKVINRQNMSLYSQWKAILMGHYY